MHAMELWHDRGDEVDLVLTDTVMPSMTGPELGRRLSAESPGVKFLYVSGSSWTSTCGAWASKVVFAADGVSARSSASKKHSRVHAATMRPR